jgi:hypothetical protein
MWFLFSQPGDLISGCLIIRIGSGENMTSKVIVDEYLTY